MDSINNLLKGSVLILYLHFTGLMIFRLIDFEVICNTRTQTGLEKYPSIM